MRKLHSLVRGAAVSGLLLAVASPAFASEKDRAQQAITEADTKIQTGIQLAPNADASPLMVEAQSSLRDAREQLGRGHERQSINAAMKASDLADRAIADSKQKQANADAASAATQGAALDAAASAQAQAADANARAAAAEQAASSAAADAANARAQAAAAAAAPPAATTITTSTETRGATVTSGSGTVVKKAPVRKKVTTTRTVPAIKTTTTVVTKPQ